MGSTAHLLVVGGRPDAMRAARSRIAELEARWSRFRPSSEISRINRARGEPCEVSGDTFELVRRSVEAWRLTRGLFDPSVHDGVLAAGYRHDLPTRPPPPTVRPRRPAPGLGGVRLDPAGRHVTLPAGLRIDPGGIGKGLATDIVARELMAAGADGALVSIGGDLRARGRSRDPRGWVVSIEDPFEPAVETARIAMLEGAVATSTRVRRSWRGATGGPEHHLVDPRSGWPAWSGSAQSTAVARDGWWAEALAKAAFLVGPRESGRLLAEAGAVGLTVDDTGTRRPSPGFEEIAA